MIKLGLLERDSNGWLKQSTALIATSDEVTASFASQIHRDFLRLASDAIHTVPRQERDISAMTLGVSLQTLNRIKEMIQEFRKEVTRVAAEDSDIETVCQLNIQLFPLVTNETKKDSNEIT